MPTTRSQWLRDICRYDEVAVLIPVIGFRRRYVAALTEIEIVVDGARFDRTTGYEITRRGRPSCHLVPITERVIRTMAGEMQPWEAR